MNMRTISAAFVLLIACFSISGALLAQEAISRPTPHSQAAVRLQWQNADATEDGLAGVSAYRAYRELLAGKTSTEVVVAIIDSGTEISHSDLDGAIWVNEDEVPDNGLDDDGNGYVDDIHGWNFIGGKDGNVEYDNLEFTRIYKKLRTRFYGKTEFTITAAERADYDKYVKMNREFEVRMEKAKKEKAEYQQLMEFYELSTSTIQKKLGKTDFTLEEVKSIQPTSELMKAAVDFMTAYFEEDLETELKAYKEHVENQFNYSYNLEYDSRSVVGDDYSNPRERVYGNNQVGAPSTDHGTHVSGIVAAEQNGQGIDGICPACRLMIIRCVPDGDERDKDVANSIRYAVDNGARVINMSFGKSYSPEKEVVDEAVRYAESKGVLLVHAAGNDGNNLDKKPNFPSPVLNDKKRCSTWIEVGASGPSEDQLCAGFSNYGKKSVDLFAPGVDIYSTFTDDTYTKQDGTSMAAPVVTGVAGALLSYYPWLSGQELKTILLSSSVKYKKATVPLPESTKTIKFGKLSRTGGVVNLYEAVKLAEKLRK